MWHVRDGGSYVCGCEMAKDVGTAIRKSIVVLFLPYTILKSF